MGKRKIRREEYNAFAETYTLSKMKNDFTESKKVKSAADLAKVVGGKWDNSGVVGREIKNRGLVVYGADSKPQVDEKAVLKAAEAVKQKTISARELPKQVLDREVKDIQERYNVSEKEAKNIIIKNDQIEAQAVLSAAAAGKVKIDAYTKGVLNNLAEGRRDQAIYGTVDETTGKRQFERGTTFKNVNPDEVKFTGASSAVNTPAAKAERRRDFIENVQAINRGGSSAKGEGFASLRTEAAKPFDFAAKAAEFRAGDEAAAKQITQRGLFGDEDNKTTRTRQPKETNLAMFSPEEMTGQGKRSNMYGEFRGTMGLEREDRRTEDEKAADRTKEANSRTRRFFDSEPVDFSDIEAPPF